MSFGIVTQTVGGPAYTDTAEGRCAEAGWLWNPEQQYCMPPPEPAPANLVASGAGAKSWLSFLALVGGAASLYHGYRRNRSVLWALVWGAFGSAMPFISLPLALAQGFGAPKAGRATSNAKRGHKMWRSSPRSQTFRKRVRRRAFLARDTEPHIPPAGWAEYMRAVRAATPNAARKSKKGAGGYCSCACRDCMEIAISDHGEPAFCHECVSAGCPDYQGVKGMPQECQSEGAYGGSEDDE